MIDANTHRLGGEMSVPQQAAAPDVSTRGFIPDSVQAGGQVEAGSGLVDSTRGFLSATQALTDHGVSDVSAQQAVTELVNFDAARQPEAVVILRTLRGLLGGFSRRFPLDGSEQTLNAKGLLMRQTNSEPSDH